MAVVLGLLLVVGAGGYKLMNSRTVQVAGELTSRVDTDRKVVALTFDDGPTAADADTILTTLADHGVRATFFVLGSEVERHPEAARALVEAGHQLGNHSWSHPRMVLLGAAEIEREITATDAAIRATGYAGPIRFRPPYGKKLFGLPQYLAEHDRHTIMWDVAVEDYASGAAQQSAGELARLTVDGVRPGSIILLHPWGGRAATQEAVGQVITGLTAEGYQFVTVDELLALG